MKTLLTVAVTVFIILGTITLDTYLYNRQFDVDVIRAKYEAEMVELQKNNYRHWEPDVTDSTGPELHDMFEATPIMKGWSK